MLADSFLEHHPDGAFTVLVIDDRPEPGTRDPRITWMRLADVGLDGDEIRRLAGIYNVTELSTAVKPLLLRRLLDDGAGEVIYLDPDIRVYGGLSDIVDLARRHDVVLTPHTMRPFPADGREVDARFVLSAGVYNLGFIAVGGAARPFLEWWWMSTRREALMDVARMMFTDQRVVDFVPALFTHHILKDPGCNVAYWNLHARSLARDGNGYAVDGVPLRFFHFSGFDIRRPWLLSKNQGARPRILLSESPTLRALCREYADLIAAAGADTDSDRRYGWSTLTSGTVVTTRMRRLYWKALRDAEQTGAPEPPSPFDPGGGDAFVAWLNSPQEHGPQTLSRYLYSVYLDRVDLQVYFRDLDGADGPRFLDWLWQVGIAPESIPMELRPRASSPPASGPAPALTPGINVAGYFRAELGIGEAARLLTTAIETAGIPYSTTTYDATLNRQQHAFVERRAPGVAYDINVVCVNADSTPQFARDIGPAFFAGRHTVGYWFWEVEAFPEELHRAFDLVDEIWTATQFVADAVRAVSRKPVFVMPLPIPQYAPSATHRSPGAGNRFTFLLMFDFLSVPARKNPLGLVEAFTRAFAADEGPVLVLKSINGHLRLNDLEQVRAAAEGRPDIRVVDGYVSHAERTAMLDSCGCYVSLHRSEGLGLTMAEAMALGKPVIATGYSGNLHFMRPENSYLVDWAKAPIPAGCAPYPTSATWADPDVGHAARLMREVYERPAEAALRGRRGQDNLATRHSVATAAAALTTRVREIRREREGRILVPDVVVPKETPMSLRAAPPPASSTAEPIESLLPHLESTAAPRAGAGTGALGGVRRSAQRLLFRVLRPVLVPAVSVRQVRDRRVWPRRHVDAVRAAAARGARRAGS